MDVSYVASLQNLELKEETKFEMYQAKNMSEKSFEILQIIRKLREIFPNLTLHGIIKSKYLHGITKNYCVAKNNFYMRIRQFNQAQWRK